MTYRFDGLRPRSLDAALRAPLGVAMREMRRHRQERDQFRPQSSTVARRWRPGLVLYQKTTFWMTRSPP